MDGTPSPPPPLGTDGNPIVVIVFDGIIQRQEESHGGDGTLKRSRCYNKNDGYGGSDGNGRTACRRANEWDGNNLSTMTMISLMATKTSINKKYDKG